MPPQTPITQSEHHNINNIIIIIINNNNIKNFTSSAIQSRAQHNATQHNTTLHCIGIDESTHVWAHLVLRWVLCVRWTICGCFKV
jgi:Trk K+ transport system NAD-binding subunit